MTKVRETGCVNEEPPDLRVGKLARTKNIPLFNAQDTSNHGKYYFWDSTKTVNFDDRQNFWTSARKNLEY